MVLVDYAASTIFYYNETASRVWDGILTGLPPDAIAHAIADASAVHVNRARADISTMVEEWIDSRLLVPVETLSPPTTADLQAPGTLPASPAWTAQWCCRIRSEAFHFLIEDAKAVPHIRGLYGHLDSAPTGDAVRLEIRTTGPYEAAVVCDGRERIRTNLPGLVVGAVHQAILEVIYPDADWLAHIHGGAVALGEVGIAFPAASGSGKTTLIAYLMKNGFDYLADDLIAIGDDRIMPWPLPLSIKRGSWAVLGRVHPELQRMPVHRTKGLEARLLPAPQNAWSLSPRPLRFVVFPRFRQGARAALVPLSAAECMSRLLADRIWLGYPLEERRISRFLDWIGRTAAYSLEYDDLKEAANELHSLARG